ncbi:expressed unknown protein [Seminavis robusta]|uniref:Pentatricopeptide repeat-containing protein n=1 Tax=Seminavis robusta TaxID=568900 RepID=A0A9N8DHL3_9STRA|nr:expressed unknown protein [Seminavis robusta]|eukprot:Sro89_g046950.1 n/a (663) ;mRNA; r:63049-65037
MMKPHNGVVRRALLAATTSHANRGSGAVAVKIQDFHTATTTTTIHPSQQFASSVWDSSAATTCSTTSVIQKSNFSTAVNTNTKSTLEDKISTPPPTLTANTGTGTRDLPPVDQLVKDILRNRKYNQGSPIQVKSRRRARRNYYWDVDACRATANAYETYLLAMADGSTTTSISRLEQDALLATGIVDRALAVLLRCRFKPPKLAERVRTWERALGTVLLQPPQKQELNSRLTLRLIHANGKAGNIGRVLALLNYRTQHQYPPTLEEFEHAISAVEVSGWNLRAVRNVFLGDAKQPPLDDPTRWLDAILLNMSARDFPLTQELANRMLDTYSSRGRSGKAVHYFYSVHRTPIIMDEDVEEVESDDDDDDDDDSSDIIPGLNYANLPSKQPRPFKVRLKLKEPPPYHKVPTEAEGKFLPTNNNNTRNDNQERAKSKGVLKVDRENDPDWSLPLTAAFSFAVSLTHGACGHEPIQLDLVSYNILIKTCVYRGALWRAMHLLDTVMPAANIPPDQRSYDSLLSGLARVGDVALMRKYYQQMISQPHNLTPSYYTVQCIVEGLLNLGDVAGAISVMQDFFNQHSVLPPVTTQLKILEFALGLDMVYEAKRHVYFIQQLWKWQPHYKYEEDAFIYFMKTYQQDPRLSKEALQHLFVYFGEKLEESDFF